MLMIARFTRYLAVLLVALLLSACTLALQPITAPAPDADLERFVDDLTVALVQRDYAHLQGLMGHSFTLAQWRAEGVERPPAIAVMNLRDRYLGAGSELTFPTAVDLTDLLDGTDPYTLWEPSVAVVDALYVTGLGLQQTDEALLMIARHADGSLYWHSILLASGGFQPPPAPATDAIAPAVSLAETSPAERTAAITTTTEMPLQAAMLPIPTIVAKPITTTLAEAAPVRLAFSSEGGDTKLRGILRPTQSRLYILQATAGQTMAVAIASQSGIANFSITGIDDGQPYKRLGDEARTWQETLPATQDYLITVAATMALPYELTIAVDAAVVSPTTEIASTQ
jgi:hypothetical protein